MGRRFCEKGSTSIPCEHHSFRMPFWRAGRVREPFSRIRQEIRGASGKSEDGEMNSDELSNYYENLIKNYPIISIEDPFAEDDFQASASFVKNWGDKLMVVGDDLFVTNIKRLEEGIKQKSANSILIKLNQIGTLSETLGVISRAKEVGWKTIVSHRSGETEDTSIAHLAVGTGSGYVKTGSVSRGERTAKYNELLRIEEEITSDYTKV